MTNKLGLVIESNEEYHSHTESISKSHLDTIANASPLHYWSKYLDPNRERSEPTPAMVLGSAIHSAILEPDLFGQEYVTEPTGINRRANAGKAEYEAFCAANKGKTVLGTDQMEACLAVRDAVHRHPLAAGLLTGGNAEQSFYAVDPETGELIKCRTDYMAGDLIVDIKSTEDASPEGFGKSAANFRYLVQTAWYQDVLDAAFGEHPELWVFLAVEKKPPYAIGIYYPNAADIAIARAAARRDFLRIVEHKRSNTWPDYASEARALSMPAWWKP